jgi:hypothetical protein
MSIAQGQEEISPKAAGDNIIAERAAKQNKELEFKRWEAQVRKMYGRLVR